MNFGKWPRAGAPPRARDELPRAGAAQRAPRQQMSFREEDVLDAAQKGDATELKRMLEQDARRVLAAKDSGGNTALHWAARNGRTAAAELLLNAKADVHAKTTQNGDTALHLAAWKGHTAAVGLLLNARADVHAENKHGNTALHDAAWTGQTAAVELLLAAKAHVHAETKEGKTALQNAEKYNHSETAAVLRAVSRLGRGASAIAAGGVQGPGAVSRRLAAKKAAVEAEAARKKAKKKAADEAEAARKKAAAEEAGAARARAAQRAPRQQMSFSEDDVLASMVRLAEGFFPEDADIDSMEALSLQEDADFSEAIWPEDADLSEAIWPEDADFTKAIWWRFGISAFRAFWRLIGLVFWAFGRLGVLAFSAFWRLGGGSAAEAQAAELVTGTAGESIYEGAPVDNSTGKKAAKEEGAKKKAAKEAEAAERKAELVRGTAGESGIHEGVLVDLAAQNPVEWPIEYLANCTDDFSEGCKLGEGAFGAVFRGVDTSTGQLFAVKRLTGVAHSRAQEQVEALQRSAQREIAVLSQFRHPHIARLLGYTIAPDTCLVYELAVNGSLDQVLGNEALATELTWRVRARICLGLAKALNYLHCGGSGQRCFHRDVKAANICLTADYMPKLIDCGLAMLIPDRDGPHAGHTMVTASCGVLGTPGYMCPRYVSNGQFGAKSEVYSFGILMLELLTGHIQNKSEDLYAVYIDDKDRELTSDMDGRAGEWPAAVAIALVKLATGCLAKFSKRLPGITPVLRQLQAIIRDHCQPTLEEKQLRELRAELDRMKQASEIAEARAAAAENARACCMICFDELEVSQGVTCNEGHFICSDCLSQYVDERVQTLLETDQLADQANRAHTAGDARRCDQLAGAMLCPVPACVAPAYRDHSIAQHVPEAIMAKYIQGKTLLPIAREVALVFEQAQEAVRAAQAELEQVQAGKAREAAKRLLEQQLQKQYPNARQCGRCGTGPVDHAACWDLQTHQGERRGSTRINNSCPRCGWFSRDINEWPRWNGRLPEDS